MRKSEKENNWWMGKSIQESEQARFVKAVYEQLLSLEDVDKIFWAYFRDNHGHFNSGVDYFGLIRWDFSIKDAFTQYRKNVDTWENDFFRQNRVYFE